DVPAGQRLAGQVSRRAADDVGSGVTEGRDNQLDPNLNATEIELLDHPRAANCRKRSRGSSGRKAAPRYPPGRDRERTKTYPKLRGITVGLVSRIKPSIG